MLKIPDPRKKRVLTIRQEKLLKAMEKHVSAKEAALSINMTPKAAYNILDAIRSKYTKARRFVNTIDAQKRRGKLFKMVLTSRIQAAEEKEWAQEEEEEEEF